jgi:DNA-binding CsgD family transcriptional regulator
MPSPDGDPDAALEADLRRADREIAAHLAVAEALSHWDSLEQGGERLLRELAATLGFALGVLWLPRCDVLTSGLFCTVPSSDTPEYERATRALRLPIGTGLPGQAWTRREPVAFENLSADPRFVRREAAARDGLRFGLAIPALLGEEVLAVVELCTKHETELTGRLRRLLIGVGHELGLFLARRRGELGASPLTARQLEILWLASQGLTSAEIAAHLTISLATVKTHLAHVYERLDVSDRAAAVAQVLRAGLIE